MRMGAGMRGEGAFKLKHHQNVPRCPNWAVGEVHLGSHTVTSGAACTTWSAPPKMGHVRSSGHKDKATATICNTNSFVGAIMSTVGPCEKQIRLGC